MEKLIHSIIQSSMKVFHVFILITTGMCKELHYANIEVKSYFLTTVHVQIFVIF